jgi:hypothetical protein
VLTKIRVHRPFPKVREHVLPDDTPEPVAEPEPEPERYMSP